MPSFTFTLGSLVKALPLLAGLVSAAAGPGFSPAGAGGNPHRLNKRAYSCDGYYCDAGYYCDIGTNGVPGCCPLGETCEGPGVVSVYTLTNTLVVVHTSYEGVPPSAYPTPTAYTTSTYYYSSTPSYPTYSPPPYYPPHSSSSSSTPYSSSSSAYPSSYPPYPPPPASYPETVTTPCYTSTVSVCYLTTVVNTCETGYPSSSSSSSSTPPSYPVVTSGYASVDYLPSCYVPTVISTPCGYPVPTSYVSSTVYPSVSSVYYNSSSSAGPESTSTYTYGGANSTYQVPPKETSGDAAVGAVARAGIAGAVAALMGLIMA